MSWKWIGLFIIVAFVLLCLLFYYYPPPPAEVFPAQAEPEPTPARPPRLFFGEFGGKSVGERLAIAAFEDLLGREVKSDFRPSFLKNPETGCNLELDAYDPILKVAIEYQGQQHYEWPNKFHTKEAFLDQLKRDKLKVELCNKEGIYLIRIPYLVDNPRKKKLDYRGRYLALSAFISYYLDKLLEAQPNT